MVTKPTNQLTNQPTNQRFWVGLILSGYLLVTVAYGVINPLFEAPDEHWHFFTAVFIAENRALPYFDVDEYDEFLSQEAAQPPLYYLLGSVLIAPIDTSTARGDVWFNPFVRIGTAATDHNINLAVHGPNEQWPWRGYALAAHVLRLFSTILGAGTIMFVWGNGRLLWPNHPHRALLAMSLVAFLPQFNFIHAAVTNDSLITFLCAAGVYQTLHLWLHGSTHKRLLILGITIGLAALTKNAGILLYIYALGTLIAHHLRQSLIPNPQSPKSLPHSLTPSLPHILTLTIPVLLLASWLWLRNAQLYGDFTATSVFIEFAGGDRGYTLWHVLRESNGLWLSLFGVFGWFNLLPPTWVYWVWNGVVVMGVVGAVWGSGIGDRGLGIGDWGLGTENRMLNTEHFSLSTFHSLLKTPRTLAPLLLFGWFLAVYAGLVAFMLQTEAAQGRLLFPAIVPLALGLAYGLSRWGRWAWLATAAALVTTLVCLFGTTRPAYAPPPTVTRLPETAVSLNKPIGNGLTLVGAETHTDTATPSGKATYTLYWQADPVPTEPVEFKLELIGQDPDVPLGEMHSYHGRGLYPANLWPEGAVIADRLTIDVYDDADVPVNAAVFIRLANDDAETESVLAGRQKLVPAEWPEVGETAVSQFAIPITLVEVQLSQTVVAPNETITIDVVWQANGGDFPHYTTLIHLAEEGQPPLATGDSPPRGGSYPTTVWEAGEVIEDSYTVTIPADLANGRYPIWIGLYDSDTVIPVPVEYSGEMRPDGRTLAGWIEVRR